MAACVAEQVPERPGCVNVMDFHAGIVVPASRVTATMGAHAADLDHRRLGREASGARGRLEFRGDLRGRRLPDRPALITEQEHDEIAGRMGMHAGNEGVAALDPVNEGVFTQELERAIDRDGRRTGSARGKPFHNLIGAQRPVAHQERRQNVPPHRGQALASLDAARLRERHGIGRAAGVVMTGVGKDRLLTRWSGSGHEASLPFL